MSRFQGSAGETVTEAAVDALVLPVYVVTIMPKERSTWTKLEPISYLGDTKDGELLMRDIAEVYDYFRHYDDARLFMHLYLPSSVVGICIYDSQLPRDFRVA